MTWQISTFYYFTPINNPQQDKLVWEQKAQEFGLRGLIIIGTEGFNTTLGAPSIDQLNQLKTWVTTYYPATQNMMFKDSTSNVTPFKHFKVKIRPEIVTLHTPELVPDNKKHQHLSPAEWDQVIKSDPDAVIIDTRNWYEYEIGTFNRAINPDIDKFTEFPKWFENQGIQKEQKILIFCTGGIRCEKGIYELERQGYQNVYQLEGGIINYIKELPNEEFKGECFIFDRRIALDQNLMPTTQYSLCPHCGQPANIKKTCKQCGSEYQVCSHCVGIEHVKDLCSKNCVYHYHRIQKKQASALNNLQSEST